MRCIERDAGEPVGGRATEAYRRNRQSGLLSRRGCRVEQVTPEAPDPLHITAYGIEPGGYCPGCGGASRAVGLSSPGARCAPVCRGSESASCRCLACNGCDYFAGRCASGATAVRSCWRAAACWTCRRTGQPGRWRRDSAGGFAGPAYRQQQSAEPHRRTDAAATRLRRPATVRSLRAWASGYHSAHLRRCSASPPSSLKPWR